MIYINQMMYMHTKPSKVSQIIPYKHYFLNVRVILRIIYEMFNKGYFLLTTF